MARRLRVLKAEGFDADAAHLSPEEQRVLAHLSASTPLRELLLSTGLSLDRLEIVLWRLETLGALHLLEDATPSYAGDSDAPELAGDVRDPDCVEEHSDPDYDQPALLRDELSHRELYHHSFAGLAPEERVELGRSVRGAHLLSLCYDVDPRVIAAIVENPSFGLLHARTIAHQHRNARGLEMLARRADLLRDGQVQQALFRNPQLPETVVERLLASRRLRDLYKLSVDHNLPDATRIRVRSTLRKRFASAPPEERVELLLKTEGRVLALLTGCTFDGRTTQILASQSFSSALLIQNLARFSATPPPILARLVQQPLVRRQPQLRTLLLRHPNMPSEIKRRT